MITAAFVYFLLQVALVLVGFVMLLLYRRRQVALTTPDEWPAVSVVSSVKGISGGLNNGLRALWNQDYPGEMEIVLITEDENDPALAESRRIVASLPPVSQRKVRWLTGRRHEGPNPRNRKMIYGFEEARHEWIFWHAIDTTFDPAYLRTCVVQTKVNKKNYASGFPMNYGSVNFGARVETVALNLEVSRFFLMTQHQRRSGPLYGGAIFAHRSLFLESGALEVIPYRLAEDVVFAKGFAALGGVRQLSPHPVLVHAERQSFRAFWDRQVRWMMIARHHMPTEFFLGLPGFLTPIYLVLALAFHSVELAEMSLAYQILRIAYAAVTQNLMGTPNGDGVNSLLLPVYDLLIPLIWATALVKQKIFWAGEPMVVQKGGVLKVLR